MVPNGAEPLELEKNLTAQKKYISLQRQNTETTTVIDATNKLVGTKMLKLWKTNPTSIPRPVS